MTHAFRQFLLPLLFPGLLLPAACDDSAKQGDDVPWDQLVQVTFPAAAPQRRAVDLVLVVDNSYGNTDMRATLSSSLLRAIPVLEGLEHGLPELHLGLITTDLGSAPYNVPGCETPGGDDGRFLRLLGETSTDPPNQFYVVDVEPRGCTIERAPVPGAPLTCASHDCTEANCEPAAFELTGLPAEPAGLRLELDARGCPRCRNTLQPTLAEEIAYLEFAIGGFGCGFEQPFEALHRALFSGAPENVGFLRSGALLAPLFFMDEDDCSVADPVLFDPGAEAPMTGELGELTSYRCARFGVTCDEPWPDANPPYGVTTLQGCVPRPPGDPEALLHPVERYIAALLGLRDREDLLAMALSGPHTDEVTVEHYEDRSPKVRCACGDESECAAPMVRLAAFLAAFEPDAAKRERAVQDLCANDYLPGLLRLVEGLRARWEAPCMPHLAAGCAAPPVAPDFAEPCNPQCRVLEEDDVTDGVAGVFRAIPPCDPVHRSGHPPDLDPDLPQEACFHVMRDELCAQTHDGAGGSRLRVARRSPAPPTARIRYACVPAP